jgi:hypothetical protein
MARVMDEELERKSTPSGVLSIIRGFVLLVLCGGILPLRGS